jgi:hypothetical protein
MVPQLLPVEHNRHWGDDERGEDSLHHHRHFLHDDRQVGRFGRWKEGLASFERQSTRFDDTSHHRLQPHLILAEVTPGSLRESGHPVVLAIGLVNCSRPADSHSVTGSNDPVHANAVARCCHGAIVVRSGGESDC